MSREYGVVKCSEECGARRRGAQAARRVCEEPRDMRVTWCVACNRFTAGIGACPECGCSPREYEPVTLLAYNNRADSRGDGREVAHSMNFAVNK